MSCGRRPTRATTFRTANLGAIYQFLGDYDKALAASQEALKLSPESGIWLLEPRYGYCKLTAWMKPGRPRRKRKPTIWIIPRITRSLTHIDFLQHDAAGMEREAARVMGKPGFEDSLLDTESDTAAYAGQFSKARELTRRASESAQRADEKETAADYLSGGGLQEALVGNMSQARQQAQAALALSTGRDVQAVSAIALGLAGDAAEATRLAADLSRRYPQDTLVQVLYLPMVRATIALQAGKGDAAIEALAPAAPYELGTAPHPLPLLFSRSGLFGSPSRRPRGRRVSEGSEISGYRIRRSDWRVGESWAWRAPTCSKLNLPRAPTPTPPVPKPAPPIKIS